MRIGGRPWSRPSSALPASIFRGMPFESRYPHTGEFSSLLQRVRLWERFCILLCSLCQSPPPVRNCRNSPVCTNQHAVAWALAALESILVKPSVRPSWTTLAALYLGHPKNRLYTRPRVQLSCWMQCILCTFPISCQLFHWALHIFQLVRQIVQ